MLHKNCESVVRQNLDCFTSTQSSIPGKFSLLGTHSPRAGQFKVCKTTADLQGSTKQLHACSPKPAACLVHSGRARGAAAAPGTALGAKVKRISLEDRSNVTVNRLFRTQGVYNRVIRCAFNAFLSFHQLQIRKHPKAGDSMLNLLLSATINSFSWLFKTQLYQVSTRKRVKMALTSICCTAVPLLSFSVKAHRSHVTPSLPSKERTPSATSFYNVSSF